MYLRLFSTLAKRLCFHRQSHGANVPHGRSGRSASVLACVAQAVHKQGLAEKHDPTPRRKFDFSVVTGTLEIIIRAHSHRSLESFCFLIELLVAMLLRACLIWGARRDRCERLGVQPMVFPLRWTCTEKLTRRWNHWENLLRQASIPWH